MINSKQERDWLNKVKLISKKIDVIYEQLEDLEKNDKKNTFIYQELIGELKNLIQEEQKCYKNEFLKDENYLEIANYLDNNLDERTNFRIANRLNTILTEYYNKQQLQTYLTYNNVGLYIRHLAEDNNEKIRELLIEQIFQGSSISIILYNQISLLNLYYLKEYIDELNNQNLKDEFIEIKYDFSFTDQYTELAMINKNFNIEKPELLSYQDYEKLLKANYSIISQTKEELLEETINFAISELLEIEDEYRLIYDDIELLNVESTLKAALYLAENKTVDNIYNEIAEYLESDYYKNNYQSNIASQNIILEIFRERINEQKNSESAIQRRLN